jgi:hypothetical protein
MRNESLLKRSTLFLALVPLAALAACNEVTTGAHGVLTFTPDDCGQDFCSLDDDLAVGSTTTVRLEAADDGDVDGLTLISSDPSILAVQKIDDGAFSSEWRVTATGSGYADLIAIDYDGYEIDHTELRARFADRLDVHAASGGAVGPTTRTGYDQVWTVNANKAIDLEVAAYRDGFHMAGAMGYQVDIDQVLFDHTSSGADLEHGDLEFNVPAGSYDVTFKALDGHSLKLLIVAQ